jgi:hypothetical protein
LCLQWLTGEEMTSESALNFLNVQNISSLFFSRA